MDGFGPRSYREQMGAGRFTPYTISIDWTDLWIGIDSHSSEALSEERLRAVVTQEILRARDLILSYGQTHRGFLAALEPVATDPQAPMLIADMISAGTRAGIGPMGAVAGTIASYVGERIRREFPVNEVVVENGGDIYIQIVEDLEMRIHAGSSPLSDRIGVLVPFRYAPVGICTSSGTVGPSLSKGTADAVMIACTSVSLADAYATAYANLVTGVEDVQLVISRIRENPDIHAAVVIKDDKAGICGEFEVVVHE